MKGSVVHVTKKCFEAWDIQHEDVVPPDGAEGLSSFDIDAYVRDGRHVSWPPCELQRVMTEACHT